MALISRHKKKSGFTLLELSVVIMIISLMLGGILSAATQEIRRAKRAELKVRMDAIEQAILSYAKNPSYYALPCPADPSLTVSSNSFGVAAASGCLSLPSYNNRIFGTVPVRSIGLPDDYALDPWGNRFTYVVSSAAATTNAFSTNDLSSTPIGNLTAADLNDNPISTTVVMYLISHGESGFGAYTPDGTKKSGYSTNTYKLTNCFCIADGSLEDSFVIGLNTNYVSTATSGDPSNDFDDIVRFYDRNFFLTSSDVQTDVP